MALPYLPPESWIWQAGNGYICEHIHNFEAIIYHYFAIYSTALCVYIYIYITNSSATTYDTPKIATNNGNGKNKSTKNTRIHLIRQIAYIYEEENQIWCTK